MTPALKRVSRHDDDNRFTLHFKLQQTTFPLANLMQLEFNNSNNDNNNIHKHSSLIAEIKLKEELEMERQTL